jgi:hypothetical protein
MQTTRDQMVARIERLSLSQGKAFSAKDFLDIASWGTIGKAKFNGLKSRCPSCKSSAFGRPAAHNSPRNLGDCASLA